MKSLVLYTHALIWYMSRSPRLSPAAHSAIREVQAAGQPLFISPVSIVEIIYLTEKGSVDTTHLPTVLSALRRPDAEVILKPFDLDIAEALQRIPRNVVPDMPDRMIAATALHLDLPLVTTDAQIRAANVQTIW